MAADQGAPLSDAMQVVVDPADSTLPLARESVVTIGCFDGVHLGHRYLVQRVAQRARETDRMAVAVTFEPHPRLLLRPDQPLEILTDYDERVALLHEAGAEVIVTARFTQALANLPPEDFTGFLVAQVGMRELWVGADFALGRARGGTVPVLQDIGVQQGFAVHPVEPFRVDAHLVKSSLIRQVLHEGELEQTNRLLGRAYDLTGTVIPGAQRGRQLGFPTANVAVPPERLLPAHGVYAVRVRIAGDDHDRAAVANLGVRPSFDGQQTLLEVHLFDFRGDLYGARLRVAFVARLRAEQRFDSVDALRAQIARDVEQARAVLGVDRASGETAERWA